MNYVQNVKLEIKPSTKTTKVSLVSQKDKILMNINAYNKLRTEYLTENINRRSLYKKGIIENKHDVLVDPDEFYDSLSVMRKRSRVIINDDGLQISDKIDDELSIFIENYSWLINNRVNKYSLMFGLLNARNDIVHNIKYKEDMPIVVDYISDVNNFYVVDVSTYQEGKHLDIKKNKFWIPTLRSVEFLEPDRIPVNNYIVRLIIRHDEKTDKFYAHFYYITDYKAIRKNMTQGVGIYLSGIPYLTLAYEDDTIKTYDSFETDEEIYNLVTEKAEINFKMRKSDDKLSDEYYELKEKKHEIHRKIQNLIYDKINEYIKDIVKDNPEYICINRPEFMKMCNNCDDTIPFLGDFNYSQYLYEFTYYKYFMKKLIQVCEEIDIPIFMTGIDCNKHKDTKVKEDYFRICSECGELDKRYKPLLSEYFECSNPDCKNFGTGNQNIKYNENCAKVLCKLPFTHRDNFKDKKDKSNYIIINYTGITDRMDYDDVVEEDNIIEL